jgi:diguanylate cyclase (GGDEF)-like protein
MRHKPSNRRRAAALTAVADTRPDLEDHRSAAHADQSESDADQTASDADQTTSERDEADAVGDQHASDEDQAIADKLDLGGDSAAEAARQTSRRGREERTIRRLITHASRSETARVRAQTSSERDGTAARRDEAAQRRDRRSEEIENAIGASDASPARQLEELRARAAADRARAAQDRAAAAIERARLEAALHTAHLDDLTGAFRREMGWLALTHEIARARRGDGRFVLAFVDVDRLKDINDRDGHAAGDEALRRVVASLRAHLRSFDPILRYGGDEFVCGLGAARLADVEHRFDLIAQSLEDIGLGVSVGLAELAPNESLDELTARADAALLVKRTKQHKAHR